MDAAYLKETVGDALTICVARTVAAAPVDPVEYLALALLKYVETSGIPAELASDKSAAEAAAAQLAATAAAAAAAADAVASARAAALAAVPELYLDPMGLWREAVAAIMANTGASSAYMAFLEDMPPKPPLAEGEEPPPEPEADPEAPPDVFDYKSKHFKYLVADEKHAFMVDKVLARGTGVSYSLLHLPKEGEAKVAAVDIPNVLYHKTAPFYFRGMPACGAYYALPIALASGEVVGFIAVDTLLETGEGSGKALPAADKEYIGSVVAAVAAAMDRADAERAQAVAEAADVNELLAAAEADAAAPPAEGEAPPEEGAEPPPPPITAESIAALVEAGEILRTEGELRLALEKHKLVQKLLLNLKTSALAEIRSYPRPPKYTVRLVKAILYILGSDKAEVEAWHKARLRLGAELVSSMDAYDATCIREAGPWALMEAQIAGLDEALLAKESSAGVTLLKWVLSTKAVSDAAGEARREAAEVAEAAAAAERARLEAEEAERKAAEEAAAAEAAAIAAAEAEAAAAAAAAEAPPAEAEAAPAE